MKKTANEILKKAKFCAGLQDVERAKETRTVH